MGTNHLAMRSSARVIITLLAALSIIAAQLGVIAGPAANAEVPAGYQFTTSFTQSEMNAGTGMSGANETVECTYAAMLVTADFGDTVTWTGNSSKDGSGSDTPSLTHDDVVLVKAGTNYQLYVGYSPPYGSPTSQDISHITGCELSFPPPPPPATVTLTIDKTQVDNRDPGNDETFTFSIVCDDGTDTTRQITGNGTATVTGIAQDADCTVTETDTAGADKVEAGTDANNLTDVTTDPKVDNIDVGTTGATAYFVNTYDAPPPPVVTNPDISLTKTAVTVDAPDGDLVPGELVDFNGDKIFLINDEVSPPFVITYEFQIENTGDVTLFDVTLTDPMLGGPLTIDQDLSGGFEPGDTATASATYTLTDADIAAGLVDNTASVTAVDEDQTEVSDTADEVISIIEVDPLVLLAPDVSVVKDAVDGVTEDTDGNLIVALSDDGSTTITYRFVVTNTGEDDLTDLTLVDDKIGDLSTALTAALEAAFGTATLPVGESVTVTADHEVSMSDFDGIRLTNVVDVTGLGVDSGVTVTDDDTETVLLTEVLDATATLPRTGLDTLALGALSLLLALLGAMALLFARRRDELDG